MRGLLDGEWHEIQHYREAEFWLRRPQYTLTNDPEAGSFETEDFDAIEEEEGQ